MVTERDTPSLRIGSVDYPCRYVLLTDRYQDDVMVPRGKLTAAPEIDLELYSVSVSLMVDMDLKLEWRGKKFAARLVSARAGTWEFRVTEVSDGD